MRYYSDILKQFFEDPDVLLKEEEKHNARIEDEKRKNDEHIEKVTKRKKELAKKIESADKALDQAYKELNETRAKCKEIQTEANNVISGMMTTANKVVREAQQARYQAVQEFNKEFGPFRTSYTGERALKELERGLVLLSDFFDPLW